jgi:hypothetical protein
MLCATQFDHRLQYLVDRNCLSSLLASTISLLEELAPISAMFRHNYTILKNVRLAVLQSRQWYSAGSTTTLATGFSHISRTQTLDHRFDLTVV